MEEAEGLEWGSATAEATNASGVDPAAVALALSAANCDPSIAEDARNFLRKQAALIDDQRHQLHEQTKLTRLQSQELSHELSLRHWSLWVRHASGLLKLALELSAGLLLLAVVGGIGITVWNAAHADGLIVESFSVPPDMASRGLTGQVVASQLLDKLTDMQSQTISVRAPRSYANNWGDDFKVEIPDTGVSVTEVYRLLRQWFGHETHISGELYRVPAGIAITVRTGTDGDFTITGPEADIAGLVQKEAENIYRATQPYRYAVYLRIHGQIDDSIAIMRTLVIPNWPELDRAFSYNAWGQTVLDREGPAQSLALMKRSLESYPADFISYFTISFVELSKGQSEAALRDTKVALSLSTRNSSEIATLDATRTRQKVYQSVVDVSVGDYRDALKLSKTIFIAQNPVSPTTEIATAEMGEHDLSAARDSLANPLPSASPMKGASILMTISTVMQIDSEAQDWNAVVAEGGQAAALAQKYPGLRTLLLTMSDPFLAYAEARQGNVAAAETRIGATPADCYIYLRMRARVAEMNGQHARSDWWFVRAAEIGPSLPFAETEWGQSLLARGRPDDAVVQFKIANQKSPHFADPLEGWGEIFMTKNESHLALAKFAEAEKYAPNWGRLHLKWGEALGYAGRKDEAQKQYALAAGLDLTPGEKSELSILSKTN